MQFGRSITTHRFAYQLLAYYTLLCYRLDGQKGLHMNKSEITYSIVEHMAVLSARHSGYTKELNLVAWNGHDEKLDVRDWAPDHSKSMKGITLTETEGRALLRALTKYFQRLDGTT